MFYSHPEIEATNELLEEIDILLSPNKLVKEAYRFITRRLGESREVYSHRLDMVTVTPTFPITLGLLVLRLKSSELALVMDNKELEADDAKLVTDALSLDLLKTDIASNLLKYGRVLTALEPLDPTREVNSLAKVLDPKTLINRGINDSFYTLRHSRIEAVSPFEPTKTLTYHTIYYPDRIETYDDEHKLVETLPTDRQRLRLYMDTPSWLGEKTYRLASALFQVENSVLETSANMYIQRTLEMGEDDPFNFEPLSTNQHILKGKFSFQESTGRALLALKEVKTGLQKDIKAIAGLDSHTEGTRVAVSGLAKQLDAMRANQIMMSLGEGVVNIINSLLTRQGINLQVKGLDSFDTTETLEMMELAEKVEALRPGHELVDSIINQLEL